MRIESFAFQRLDDQFVRTTRRQFELATIPDRFLFAYQDIHAATGIPYRDMLFFDDEKSNITTVSKLGVTCVKLSKEFGLTFGAVNAGLKQYREACLSRASLKDWFTPAPRKNEAEGSGRTSESSCDPLVDDREKAK